MTRREELGAVGMAQIGDCPWCEGRALQRATHYSHGVGCQRSEYGMENVRKPAQRMLVALQASGTGPPRPSWVPLLCRGCDTRSGVQIALRSAEWERGPGTGCRNHR